MFHKLVNHNKDIERLVTKGYAIGFDGACMVVRDVPYLDENKKLKSGAIVTKLEFVNKERVKPDDHQVFFAGGVPHSVDGKPLTGLGGGPKQFPLSESCADIVVERSFSCKLMNKGNMRDYKDFYEKIDTYASMISGPATQLYGATPLTFNVQKDAAENSIFNFNDTLTVRAEIADLAAKFEGETVAVIGLGGSGSYVLDFLMKTPIPEIRGYDSDTYHVHNTFRSPGKIEEDELGKTKAEVYQARYENYRNGVNIKTKHIDSSCPEELDGVTFAFVNVDKGSSRAEILDVLIEKKIPFIDVGLGISRAKDGSLKGMLRATYYSVKDAEKMRAEKLAEEVDNPDDIYKTNIQIGELNALNACLAVIKYKMVRGFYYDQGLYQHILFALGNLKIVGDYAEN